MGRRGRELDAVESRLVSISRKVANKGAAIVGPESGDCRQNRFLFFYFMDIRHPKVPMSVLLFEDPFVDRLHPVTYCRPAYAISCGGMRLIDIVGELGRSPAASGRGYLDDLQQMLFPQLTARVAEPRRLLVNARLVPNYKVKRLLEDVCDTDTVGAVWQDQQLMFAALPPSAPLPVEVAATEIPSYVREMSIPELDLPSTALRQLGLLDYPHSIIAEHLRIFPTNLVPLSSNDVYQEVSPGVYATSETSLGEYIVTDTSRGPIVLDSGAVVGPFCHLSGPLYVGRNATIHARTTVHPYVSLGHTVKIGGEVEASIVEPYSNKQHHGYLGHSYLGSWVNLGAGTSNSNLKNTYGQVNMMAAGAKVPTGMRLMGCVLGDYAKTAINTSILTGRMVGVASMLYGFVAQDVPSFVNYAHQFGDVSSVCLDSAQVTQRRMFERRGVSQSMCEMELLAEVYAQTKGDRLGLETRPPRLA